ncbi:Lrp/AsnC family transcriptional regulator, regulator for asnA, asnC and gidA [Spirosomataceae bacterium TFI 002]|nr:Lrp/AsnC family transcriptional regulator, regulator for asnA, asnC and gidA [Spirosomataceae bacterium TFI 002]
MDKVDLEILKLLELNARKPYAEIANQLGISNTMVHQRVNKLREKGILLGTTVKLDESKLGYEWSAFTGIILKEDSSSADIIKELEKIPEVTECYYITGQYTLYIRIVAKSSQHMRAVLYDKIDHIPGVLKTESLIHFGTAFKRNAPLI